MADVHSKETRNYNMTQIRGKDTKIEILIRKYLFSRGLRYRKNDNRYPGKPDMVFPKYKTIVFANSCFWHGHEGCSGFVMPRTNIEYWQPKIEGNKRRDAEHIAELQANGWRVITVWECECGDRLRKVVRDERLAKLYDEIVAVISVMRSYRHPRKTPVQLNST